MRRRDLLIGTLCLLGALAPGPPARAAEDPAHILSKSLSAEATFTGEQVAGPAGQRVRPGRVQRVFRKGNIIRINYANGQVMFDDGAQMLLYLPRQGFVEKAP